jgi:hypothetical protein
MNTPKKKLIVKKITPVALQHITKKGAGWECGWWGVPPGPGKWKCYLVIDN